MYGPALLGMLGLALHQSPALMFRPWHRMQREADMIIAIFLKDFCDWQVWREEMREAIGFSFIILLQRETHSKYTMSAGFFCFVVFYFPSAEPFSVWKHEAGDILYLSDCQQIPRNEQNKRWMSNEQVKAYSSAPQSWVVVQKLLQTPHSCTARYVPSLHFSGGAKTVFMPKIVLNKCTSSPCFE